MLPMYDDLNISECCAYDVSGYTELEEDLKPSVVDETCGATSGPELVEAKHSENIRYTLHTQMIFC
ncbi:hypothetical protein COCNU_04G012710 [Cocos nucifera]|uniref:Uncharacterized protein n=1 Tax=Cocos nucifera TaxID=13894 RepID=A0A8K0I6M1_COCNU|nr:hypothetical protein COCNU_04G012710 [Cocos nucifera]